MRYIYIRVYGLLDVPSPISTRLDWLVALPSWSWKVNVPSSSLPRDSMNISTMPVFLSKFILYFYNTQKLLMQKQTKWLFTINFMCNISCTVCLFLYSSHLSLGDHIVIEHIFNFSIGRDFFSLQPEANSTLLQQLYGQLCFQRDDWRRGMKVDDKNRWLRTIEQNMKSVLNNVYCIGGLCD